MKFGKIINLVVAATVLAGSMAVPSLNVSAAGVLKLGGSTTISPLATALKPDFETKTGIALQISEGGSGAGLTGVLNGTFDIGMMSRDLTESEKKLYPYVIPITIGKDAVCVIMNSSNTASSNLTPTQVYDIFSSSSTAITNWSQVGGANASINIHTRVSTSGTLAAFKELALRNTNVKDTANVWESNERLVAEVANDPNGIGFCSMSFIDSPGVKSFSFDGVVPSEATAKSGAYKLVRPLNYITKREAVGDALKWLYYNLSPDGQSTVKAKGYLKINENPRLTIAVGSGDTNVQNAVRTVANDLDDGIAMPIDVVSYTSQDAALQDVVNGTKEAVVIKGLLPTSWSEQGLYARVIAQDTQMNKYNYVTKGFGSVDALGAQELLRQLLLNPKGQKTVQSNNLVRAWIFGDCNGDGAVDSADFSNIRAYILGKITYMNNQAWLYSLDVNGDKSTDAGDYGAVKAYLLEKIKVFSASNSYSPFY